MRKGIRCILILMIIFTLAVIFLSEGKKLCSHYLKLSLAKAFKGQTTVGSISFKNNQFNLHSLKVNDITQSNNSVFIFIKRISIPLSFIWQKTKPEIILKGLKLNLHKNQNQWNIWQNMRLSNPSAKNRLKLPFKKLKILESAASITVPIKGKPFAFFLNNLKAEVGLNDDQISFLITAEEKESGACASAGKFNLKEKNLYLTHTFKNIQLNKPFCQKFFKQLFPLLNNFKFMGEASIDIITPFDQEWQSPTYKFSFKQTDWQALNTSWHLKNLSSQLTVNKNQVVINKAKADLWLQETVIPFKKLETEFTFTKNNIDLKKIRAYLFKGKMEGKGSFTIDKAYQLYLKFIEMDLKTLCHNFSFTKPEACTGLFSFDTQLSSSKKHLWDIAAFGNAEIQESNLFKLPLFTGIFNFLNLELPKKEKTRQVTANWTLTGNYLFLDDIKIKGNSLSLYGDGVIKNKNLIDFNFAVQLNKNRVFTLPPVVGEWTRKASNKLLQELTGIKVSGTLKYPEFNKITFSHIPLKMTAFFQEILSPLDKLKKKILKN